MIPIERTVDASADLAREAGRAAEQQLGQELGGLDLAGAPARARAPAPQPRSQFGVVLRRPSPGSRSRTASLPGRSESRSGPRDAGPRSAAAPRRRSSAADRRPRSPPRSAGSPSQRTRRPPSTRARRGRRTRTGGRRSRPAPAARPSVAAASIARQANRAPRLKLAGIMSAGNPSAARCRACSRNTEISSSPGGSPRVSHRITRSRFQRTHARTSSRAGWSSLERRLLPEAVEDPIGE